MAETTVKMRYFADAAAAERAIVQLEKKHDALEQKIKRTNKTSKDGSVQGVAGMTALLSSVGSLVGGYLSLQGALRGVQAWYRSVSTEIENAAKSEAKFNRSLLTTLTLSGDLAVGPRVKQALQNLPGVTEAQGAAAFGGVRAGAPTIDVERALSIATAVSALSPNLAPLDELGKVTDLSQLTELGELAGKLGALAPEKSAGDIVDLAVSLEQITGGRQRELTQPATQKAIRAMLAEGLGFEEALATAAVGLQQELSSRQLSTAAGRKVINQEAMRGVKAQLLGVQAGDAALQQLELGRATDPGSYVRQGIFGRDEKEDRALGSIRDAMQATQQAAIEEAPLWARPLVQAGVGLRNMIGTTQLSVFGPDTGDLPQRTDADAIRFMEMSARTLEEIRDLLKRDEVRRPQINRGAHVEGD